MRVALKAAGLHPREEQFIDWVKQNMGARAPKIAGAFAALSQASDIASPMELMMKLTDAREKVAKRLSPATANAYARRFKNAYRAWEQAESQIVERDPKPVDLTAEEQLQLEVASLLEESVRWPSLQPFLLPFCANVLRQGRR